TFVMMQISNALIHRHRDKPGWEGLLNNKVLLITLLGIVVSAFLINLFLPEIFHTSGTWQEVIIGGIIALLFFLYMEILKHFNKKAYI
ncbi:MAG: hypothetical protein GXN92_00210, partial [Candidatus Micrarchaeota archaeon]|nr:hypothetical protein [Candidatus Micrarchaeota archaeon]